MADDHGHIMPPAIANDTLQKDASDHMDKSQDRSLLDPDTCRICRSEATPEEPLFHPCKCSGSIGHVHQECLMEWLSHTNKKYCELCKTPFRFTKLYDANMPDKLPVGVFVARACRHIASHFLIWLRAALVMTIWLVLLPWSIRWAWRGMFFMCDGGWARVPWIMRMAQADHNATDLMPLPLPSNTTGPITSAFQNFLATSSIFRLVMALWNLVAAPWSTSPRPPLATFSSKSESAHLLNITNAAAQSTLFSDLRVPESLTTSPEVQRAILDILEGQIITLVVVFAFILVFLIREWVIQQQPILNAQAVRDAEQRLNHVEEVRQRLREDIRHIEEQLEILRGANMTIGSALPDPTARMRQDLLDSQAPIIDDEPDSQIDWLLFANEIEKATQTWLDTHRYGTEARHIVRELADKFTLIVAPAIEGEATDIKTFERLIEWVRSIPPEADAAWLSGTASGFVHLKSGSGRGSDQSNTAGSRLARVEGATEAPLSIYGDMAPTGSNSGSSSSSIVMANQHSSASAATPMVGAVPTYFDADTAMDIDNEDQEVPGDQYAFAAPHGAFLQDNLDGTESWLPTATPGEATAHDVAEAFGLDTPSTPGEDGHVAPIASNTSAPAASAAEAIEHDRQPTESVQHEPVRPTAEAQGIRARVFALFWGDIPIVGGVQPGNVVPVNANHNELDIFEFVGQQNGMDDDLHDHHHDHDHDHEHEAEPANDPEVVAAAQLAGLDAEAVEDAEDLEGVMELIGMQGPIAVLIQTSLFCALLVTLTLWTTLGAPYLCGKVVLQVYGDPVLFFVVLPLQIVAHASDLLLDLATILTGGFLHWSFAAIVSTLSLLKFDASAVLLGGYLDSLNSASQNATENAAKHLIDFFVFDADAAGTESYFLLASLQSHQALTTAKHAILVGFQTVGSGLEGLFSTSLNSLPYLCWSTMQKVAAWIYQDVLHDATTAMRFMSSFKGRDLFALTLYSPRKLALDPILSFWSGTDRTLAILIGYLFLGVTSVFFSVQDRTYFTSPTLQRLERTAKDNIRQAGGVLKVILIISIEMLLFPLYCGMLLDIALMPLFEGVTFQTRLSYAVQRPYMFVFLHWFLGTAYMFNFALFVSMCRRILRSGVLYFIRDPDDPTFHPVRDVLERNISTQLRKIGFSALVYGLMVIFCMGGVVWGVAQTGRAVFPVRWSTPDPVLEFPLEFLLYNFVSPILFRVLRPSQGVEWVYEWWLRKCAHVLRLSHFLFGRRDLDEEQTVVDPETGTKVKSGMFAKVPASDQVRIQKGQAVFTEVTEQDVEKDEADQVCDLHGREGQKYRCVYTPPWFRLRIALFLGGLWLLSAMIGASFTIIPLIIGRAMFENTLPHHVQINDIWAYFVGLHTLLLFAFVISKMPVTRRLVNTAGNAATGSAPTIAAQKTARLLYRAAKCLYVYGFTFMILPLLSMTLVHLYVVIPLYGLSHSAGSANSALNETISNGTLSANSTSLGGIINATMDLLPFALPGNVTAVAPPSQDPPVYITYIAPDWMLGFMLSRLMTQILPFAASPLPAAIKRHILRNGRWNPDAAAATRAYIGPVLLFSAAAMLTPPALAALVHHLVLPLTPYGGAIDETARVRLYRGAYPIVLGVALAAWLALAFGQIMTRWQDRIKDEVYLIGERLHNLGESRPPDGSRSVMKKGKEVAVGGGM